MSWLKQYKGSLAFLIVALVAVGIYTKSATVITAILILVPVEISLSFDNAIVNATVLKRMTPFWQKLFMTLGVVIAVIGMRLLVPIVIVMPSAHLGFGKVVDLALNHPQQYAAALDTAHSTIAMFAGVYLLQIALTFFFDEERETVWLKWIERPLAKIGKLDQLATILASVTVLIIVSQVHKGQLALMTAGFISILSYVSINSIANLFEDEDEELEGDEQSSTASSIVQRHGWAAFWLFMYLEMQDASFSFDGVSGAFAITPNIIAIAVGLGVGAAFVRSMTVHFVSTDKIGEYRYLEHGAFYAIASLAILMLTSIFVGVNEFVTGPIGVAFIVLAFGHSKLANKRDARNELDENDTSTSSIDQMGSTHAEVI